MTGLIAILIWLIILGVVVGLVYFMVDTLPIPDPIGRIIKVVAVVIVCIFIILLLMQVAGVGPTFPKIQ